MYLLIKVNAYFLEKSYISKQQYKASKAFFKMHTFLIHLILHHLSTLFLNFIEIGYLFMNALFLSVRSFSVLAGRACDLTAHHYLTCSFVSVCMYKFG